MSVVFEHENAKIKIYEESGGVKGAALTSDWLYVEHIKCTETVQNAATVKLFAGYNKQTTIGKQITLTIDKLHYDKSIDWELASSRTDAYWIEIEFEEQAGAQTETYTCKHCRYDERSLDTQSVSNRIGRRWIVGIVE